MSRSYLTMVQRRRNQRLLLMLVVMGLAMVALGCALMALNESIIYFYSPTSLNQKNPKPNLRVRLGGVVVEHSFVVLEGIAQFEVTDFQTRCKVTYKGDLPDLFREGQGVVVEGFQRPKKSLLSENLECQVDAESVLAKHDENYMPPEVAAAIKDAGVWREASSDVYVPFPAKR